MNYFYSLLISLIMASALTGCGSGSNALNNLAASEAQTAGTDKAMPVKEILFRSHPSVPVVKLRVPVGYDPGLVGWWEPYMPGGVQRAAPGEIESVLLFFATWPEMEPKTPQNQAKFKGKAQEWGRINVGKMYAHNPFKGREELDDWYQIKRRSAAKSLEPNETFIDYPGKFGLKVEGLPLALIEREAAKGIWSRDSFKQIFSLKDAQGQVQTVISCTFDYVPEPEDIPNPERVPQCTHLFYNARLNAVVDLGYRRKYLAQWREHQARAESLLQSFIVPIQPKP